MTFLCCGLIYKKNDINTYWCIDTYLMKPILKKFVGTDRIFKELVEACICKKCGCQHVKIKRYGRAANGKIKLVETEILHGDAADLFLLEYSKYLILQEQKCPYPLIASAATIPFVYGHTIAPNEQRAKYIAALPQKEGWRDKFENGMWQADIFKSDIIKKGKYEL